MNREYLLGIDIGTSATKGVLTTVTGEVVSVESNSHSMEMPRPGWFEQDPEKVWWGDVVSVIQKLISTSGVNPANVIGIGVSGLGQDILPVDSFGNPVRRKAILYGIDTRAVKEITEMNVVFGKENILKKTANGLSTQATGPKILWLKRNEPDVYSAAACFVTASTFIVGKLTGELFLDHHQASFWVPLYDFYNYCWSEEYCHDIVEPHRLPRLLWPIDVAGKLTKDAASVTGLCEGTPVIVGSSDAYSESISVGAVEPGKLMIMYGSTTCMFMQLNQLAVDGDLWSYHSYQKGIEGLAMCTATSGAITQWFRDNFARDLLNAEKMGEANAYERLIVEARIVAPGSDGIIVLPYFSGERSPIYNPDARGVIFGLDLSHKRGHLFKAILEGNGYSIRHNLNHLQTLGVRPDTIIAAGGGTRNPLWLQVVSDICQRSQMVPNVDVGAAYGDAFMAGVGIGLHQMDSIGKWISYPKLYTPNKDVAPTYDRSYYKYRELYTRNCDLMK